MLAAVNNKGQPDAAIDTHAQCYFTYTHARSVTRNAPSGRVCLEFYVSTLSSSTAFLQVYRQLTRHSGAVETRLLQ